MIDCLPYANERDSLPMTRQLSQPVSWWRKVEHELVAAVCLGQTTAAAATFPGTLNRVVSFSRLLLWSSSRTMRCATATALAYCVEAAK